MKIILKFLLVSLSFITIQLKVQAINSNDIQISLLTCSSGDIISSSFGHSAIRITNQFNNSDIVYDFGVFDFNDPHFIYNFINGNLNYRLDQRSFVNFLESYKYENRNVIEERLHLDYTQKIELIKALRNNYKPENRYYSYDFFKDNCSTRIRDLFIQSDFIYSNSLLNKTFRENLDLYISNRPWYKLGIDLVLGQKADIRMNYTDAMFLPNILSLNLKEFENTKLKRKLVQNSEVLISFENQNSDRIIINHPLYIFSIAFLLVLFLFFKNNTLLLKLTPYFYALTGLIGFILVYMWFATSHPYTKFNNNLIWLNPFYLLLLYKSKFLIKYLLRILIFSSSCFLIFWSAIPQGFNSSIIPLVLLLIILNFNKLNKLKL